MQKGRYSAHEVVIVTVVVALSIVLGISLYSARSKVEKGRIMINELSMIRSAIVHYKMVNHKAPDLLEDLSKATYEAGSMKRSYLDRIPLAKGGRSVDPFGNPYWYDPKSGWVASTSPGFERW